jgi:hypothetical protein
MDTEFPTQFRLGSVVSFTTIQNYEFFQSKEKKFNAAFNSDEYVINFEHFQIQWLEKYQLIYGVVLTDNYYAAKGNLRVGDSVKDLMAKYGYKNDGTVFTMDSAKLVKALDIPGFKQSRLLGARLSIPIFDNKVLHISYELITAKP